jgi:hypothetical protein
MTHTKLADELNIGSGFIAITRKMVDTATLGDPPVKSGCTLRALKQVLEGKSIILTKERISCGGGQSGFGFVNGMHYVPGGFGNFLSAGAGEGFPPGERLKCSPEVAESMITYEPQKVLDGYNAVEFKPFEEGDRPDLITSYVNADQLSALVSLFSYRTGVFDNIIMPMSAGCSSIVRLPLGELRNSSPRAVVGNTDITSRFFFDAGSFFFTIPAAKFAEMLEDADECFIYAPTFKGVKKRLKSLL